MSTQPRTGDWGKNHDGSDWGQNTRVGREIEQGWSGMDHTHDRVMGLDEHMSKSTISVVGVNAVPIRAIGTTIRGGVRGRRSDLHDARLGGTGLHVAVEVAVQDGELESDDRDGGLHLGLPLGEGLIKGSRSLLDRSDAGVTMLAHGGNLLQALGEGSLMNGEHVLDLGV
jgi:hypothetical protein